MDLATRVEKDVCLRGTKVCLEEQETLWYQNRDIEVTKEVWIYFKSNFYRENTII